MAGNIVDLPGCDLLENLYLCGSNNNSLMEIDLLVCVVICLKICTFAVATTTVKPKELIAKLL